MAQEQTTLRWVPKALTIVLYLQAGLAAFVGLASVLTLSGFANDAGDGRRLAAVFWAYAFMLLAVVVPHFKRERRVLLVPLAWTAFLLVDSLYELLALGDTVFIPPVIFEVTFLALYVASYRALSRK
ncbi:MAG: hypothetical protein HY680_02115 [Chloroflexi bacterium]|nr:hypothetical protein [Chloroflexota bacterium]